MVGNKVKKIVTDKLGCIRIEITGNTKEVADVWKDLTDYIEPEDKVYDFVYTQDGTEHVCGH